MTGSGISWLWPFVDNAPPIGWDEASRYLVLPVLLVVAQFVSSAIITPPTDPEDESAKRTQVHQSKRAVSAWHVAIQQLFSQMLHSSTSINPFLCSENQVILKFLPLMIGWFSLNLPSGLGLYYFANTALTTAQQIWLRKLGGAPPPGHHALCPWCDDAPVLTSSSAVGVRV